MITSSRNKKIKLLFATTLVVALAIGLLVPGSALAEGESSEPSFNPASCVASDGGNAVTCSIYGLTYIVSYLGSVATNAGGWAIKIALTFNDIIIDSPVVQTGFSVMLGIANLGFVLGIIIIAFATMLRRQTYGMKQLLFKLVLIAVLVNFSLVIAGVVINFANDLTIYFVNQTIPEESIADTNEERALAYSAWSTRITEAFAPEAFLEPPDRDQGGFLNFLKGIPGATGQLAQFIEVVANPGDTFSTFLQTFTGLVFALVFTFIIAFTMWALAIMLFIRYAYLSILLIVMPLAWLLWVFPATVGTFRKWWAKLIRWALFPPAIVFFLYLVMLIAVDQAGEEEYLLDNLLNSTSEEEAGLLYAVASAEIVTAAGRAFVVVTLAIGGLFAANSFSIAFAGTAMSWAKNTGKWATRQVGRGARRGAQRGGARVLGGERGREWARRMQQAGAGGNALQRFIAAPVRAAGRGLEGIGAGGGAQLVNEFQDRVKDYTKDQTLNEVGGTIDPAKRMALLEKAREGGYLQEAAETLPSGTFNREAFKRFNKESLFKEAGGDFKEFIESGKSLVNEEGRIDEELVKALRKLEPKQALKYLKLGEGEDLPLDISRGSMLQLQRSIVQGSTQLGWNTFQNWLKEMTPQDRENFHGIAQGLVESGELGYAQLVAGGINKPLEKGAISGAYNTENVFGVVPPESESGGQSTGPETTTSGPTVTYTTG